jgi:uncharacterized iron-regulated membrane protein
LGILFSGLYLWLPTTWSRRHIRPSIWFRAGLTGKRRDWNWHNTIGIWCAVPLVVIVASAVVMSYGWANNLVYRVTGSEAPQLRGGPGRAEAAPGSGTSLAGVDAAMLRALEQVSGWTSISLRLPLNARAPLVFTIDTGDGGRPDLRSQLTLARGGELLKWEPFERNSAGRRLRSWIRFSHTGEAGGISGETVAFLASVGAVFLAWTGISLAIRRLAGWNRRRGRQATEYDEQRETALAGGGHRASAVHSQNGE